MIEAPGKKDAFRASLDAAGFESEAVVATFGRLFDLPPDRLGFELHLVSNPQDFGEITWVPKRPDQIGKLARILSTHDEIVIATDTDLEGELIASQVVAILRLAKEPISPVVVRARVTSITPEHLKSAYASAAPINENAVKAAKAKRVLDRILGFCLHDPSSPWRMSVGRVVTPLVSSLSRTPPVSAVLRRKLSDGWSAIVRLKAPDMPEVDQVLGMLHSLPDPHLLSLGVIERQYEHKPLTGPEAIVLCTRTLDLPPSQIQSSLQSNYEKGRLTYPRTDSRILGEVSRKWIERAAASSGVQHNPEIVEKRQSERLQRAYDAHEAVVPAVSEWASNSIPNEMLSCDDAVLRVIAEYCTRLGTEAEAYTSEIGTLDPASPATGSWRSALSKWSSGLEFVRHNDDLGYTQDPLRHEYVRKPTKTQGNVQLWKLSPEEVVLERMIEIGLGRPSTVLSLSHKTVGNYLTHDGVVNGRGKLMLRSVRGIIPELLDPAVARDLERVVAELDSELSIGERLKMAWAILGNNPRVAGENSASGAPSVTPENTEDAPKPNTRSVDFSLI
ncbi:DNA topoisomerase [Pseudomonas aeruginosa]